jgi:RimJ/RimL family protein N-acetyltransferase
VDAPPLPLVDPVAGLALRRWRPPDATSLAAAWADGEISGPERVEPADAPTVAARWIRGWEARLAADLSLDLVVGPIDGDEVWGEVGLVRLRLRVAPAGAPGGGASSDPVERAVWELGWWLAPEQRGRGRAAPAVALLLGWLDRTRSDVPVVARIRPGNVASTRVATRVGLVRRGRFDGEHDLWVRPGVVALPEAPGDGV